MYRTKESSSSVVDVHNIHVPLLALWGSPHLKWAWRPCLLSRLRSRSLFCPRWSSFAIWTNFSSTNVPFIGCGNDATSGTTSGMNGTSIGVIRVSSTGGWLMSVDGASLRTNVCLVLLVWAPPPLIRTHPDQVMDDIDCW